MFHLRWLTLSLLLISIAPAPTAAQARALLVFGHGGRMFSLTNLSDAGDDMSAGTTFGGGIGLQIGTATALRASVSISESSHRGPTLNLGDPVFKRSYYGGDIMFGTPSDGGLAPYVFIGGGRVVIDPAEPGTDRLAKWAGRLGTGMNYVPDNSFFVLFAEVGGWVYPFDLFGFDKLQFETAVLGGITFAVPF